MTGVFWEHLNKTMFLSLLGGSEVSEASMGSSYRKKRQRPAGRWGLSAKDDPCLGLGSLSPLWEPRIQGQPGLFSNPSWQEVGKQLARAATWPSGTRTFEKATLGQAHCLSAVHPRQSY